MGVRSQPENGNGSDGPEPTSRGEQPNQEANYGTNEFIIWRRRKKNEKKSSTISSTGKGKKNQRIQSFSKLKRLTSLLSTNMGYDESKDMRSGDGPESDVSLLIDPDYSL